ncbi:MAG: bifunctional DNA-formamidopyrimidine glycosylase/DNA-(apurinic or apyrimidinic site) lyase [Gammaproteobacteria bacterium]
MPELPEVETTRRGIEPHIAGLRIIEVMIRQPRLRWNVDGDLESRLQGKTVQSVLRRAKYLLLDTGIGALIIHLGMSGSLRIVSSNHPAGKHDHADFVFADGTVLRFNDPRRFGAILWTDEPAENHHLLKSLGPEPLSEDFDGAGLHRLSRGRSTAVKSFIMDSRIVVGVGNIYANEALFHAGIHPARRAGGISLARYLKLADCIRLVLSQAIEQGGTTLRDFVNESGKAGYFQQMLTVYGRGGEPCFHCREPVRQLRIAQRMSYYCPSCQR